MKRIKKGDEVIVAAGKDKGHVGKVIKRKGDYVFVEGAAMLTKYVKPNPQQNEKGGIKKEEGPVHQSNLALYNPITKKGDKIGFKFLENGDKVRYFKSTNEIIDRN
jgi:large subunit ribosomal protein L24